MGIQFQMAARCEAAGRSKNEDNFQISNDLSDNKWQFATDEIVDLGTNGALMVVCDGMGGQTAGEYASALAVETIEAWFASDRLSTVNLANPGKIKKHISDAITAADTAIKNESLRDQRKEGMGTTIVLAWFLDAHVYIGWCGDSRAYRFNPATGLEALSNDHSYVQELVATGKLSRDLAFDHPNNNIITRSLGDPHQHAKPDIRCIPLHNEDVILLCSDGLCGVLRDHQIESVIAENLHSMGRCRDALWNASEEAGWNDNVTVALCQIITNDESQPQNESQPQAINLSTMKSKKKLIDTNRSFKSKSRSLNLPVLIVSIILLVLAAFIAGYFISIKH